jgi:hypothetical protein
MAAVEMRPKVHESPAAAGADSHRLMRFWKITFDLQISAAPLRLLARNGWVPFTRSNRCHFPVIDRTLSIAVNKITTKFMQQKELPNRLQNRYAPRTDQTCAMCEADCGDQA